MNKLISGIFAATLTLGAISVYAATTPNNTDDGSSIGTSESPQHKQQSMRTNKGNTENMKKTHTNKSKLMKTKKNNILM